MNSENRNLLETISIIWDPGGSCPVWARDHRAVCLLSDNCKIFDLVTVISLKTSYYQELFFLHLRDKQNRFCCFKGTCYIDQKIYSQAMPINANLFLYQWVLLYFLSRARWVSFDQDLKLFGAICVLKNMLLQAQELKYNCKWIFVFEWRRNVDKHHWIK